MSDSGLNDALVRLLISADLRAKYRKHAREVAQELSVSDADLTAFVSLDPIELDRQAECLIGKRFYEASRLIPQTICRVGAAGKQHFHCYATQYWPTGHQRHLRDAVEFCRYLEAEGLGASVCRSEVTWLQFSLSRTSWAIHFVGDLIVRGKRRPAIQLFYRRRGVPRRFAWHF